MAEPKTKPTAISVEEFLNSIPDPVRRADCITLAKLMKKLTRSEPKMWSASIVGFGDMIYHNSQGKGMDWFVTGFSPRKNALTLYLGFLDEGLLAKLGKHSRGVGCLYVKNLAEVDRKVLAELVAEAASKMKVFMAERARGAAK
ncbi:MAG: DUF1801 domain-containing protein [Acidobacteriota bacterium]